MTTEAIRSRAALINGRAEMLKAYWPEGSSHIHVDVESIVDFVVRNIAVSTTLTPIAGGPDGLAILDGFLDGAESNLQSYEHIFGPKPTATN